MSARYAQVDFGRQGLGMRPLIPILPLPLITKIVECYNDRSTSGFFGSAFVSGAVMALETDQSNGAAVHREMELLVAAGIPVLDVIKIATLNGAKFLGKEDIYGSITEGKLADMVLLEANPITDINNTKKIYEVIKGGQIIDRSNLDLPVNK